MPDQLVEQCLRAATHAPSAENKQPWVFVVVRDDDLRRRVADLTRRAWRQGGRAHSEGRLPAALLDDVHRGAESGMEGAPVLVVVCGDRDLGLESTLPASVYPATQNLLLAADALGLGSAMTTLATLFSTELRAVLGLPERRPAHGRGAPRVARPVTRPAPSPAPDRAGPPRPVRTPVPRRSAVVR